MKSFEKGGTYILIKYMKKGTLIDVGSLGSVYFKKGFYAYAGSALGKNSIVNRVGRHIKKVKKLRWHIDYIENDVREVWFSDNGEKLECIFAKSLLESSDSIIKRFGSSDCRCVSHLFHFRSYERLKKAKKLLLKENNLKSTWRKISFNTGSEEVKPLKISYFCSSP